jgi:uncharacterized RDD family membrane protein YckC
MSDPAKRAGFRRRAFAFVMDLLLVNMLVAAVGLAAIELTGGRVRVANTIDDVRSCGAWQPLAPDLPVSNEFAGGEMRRCTRAVHGFEYDRTLVVREAAISVNPDAELKQATLTTDADGRPVRAFYLDSLSPLVLAVYLLLLEWRFGATFGKWAFDMRVRTLGGGPIDFWQAGKRALIRALVVLGSAETQVALRMTTAYALPDLGLWSELINLLALMYVGAFAVAVSSGLPALHDLWAGTQVVLARGAAVDASRADRD